MVHVEFAGASISYSWNFAASTASNIERICRGHGVCERFSAYALQYKDEVARYINAKSRVDADALPDDSALLLLEIPYANVETLINQLAASQDRKQIIFNLKDLLKVQPPPPSKTSRTPSLRSASSSWAGSK
jgi:hypothetical protein